MVLYSGKEGAVEGVSHENDRHRSVLRSKERLLCTPSSIVVQVASSGAGIDKLLVSILNEEVKLEISIVCILYFFTGSPSTSSRQQVAITITGYP